MPEDNVWAELRKPFPKSVYGKVPKPYKKDSPKGQCNVCGGYHGLPAVHLDYVGHAAVTDRLNTVVGPANWTLEPMALDERGNPMVDRNGQLWCWLTVLGARKMCVGDGATSAKELISDALRNGAMRFGIALDLWTKDELESQIEDRQAHPEPAPPLIGEDVVARIRSNFEGLGFTEHMLRQVVHGVTGGRTSDVRGLTTHEVGPMRSAYAAAKHHLEQEQAAISVSDEKPAAPDTGGITPTQLQRLHILLSERGVTDRDEKLRVVTALIDRAVESTKDLTRAEARIAIGELERMPVPQS